MSAKSVVFLQGVNPDQDEALASVAVKPGHMLIRHTDGTVKPHDSAAATTGSLLIAVERTEIGEGITGTYAIGDTVKFHRAKPGHKYTMWLKTGNNAAIESRLESAGDGTLQLVSTGKCFVRAYEALNNATGSPALIQVTVVDS
jgi:hypothetical protein